MSYLPSSRFYDCDAEPTPVVPPVAVAPKPATPRPAPPAVKEWIVPSAPILRVETPEAAPIPDTPIIVTPPQMEKVTIPASILPEPPPDEFPARRRNIFHRAHKVVLRHLDRAKTKAAAPNEPDLLWFAVMVVGSLSMGLMIWGAYSALPRFGNVRTPLRHEASATRLKGSHDVPVRWIHETGPIQPQPHVPPLVPPAAPSPQVYAVPIPAPPHEPPLHERRSPLAEHQPAAQVESPLAPLPERKDPVIFVTANMGDTPMIRTWKKLADTSLFLAAFSLAPTNNLLAQIPDKIQVDYSKQIADLTKAVQTLSDQVAGMKIDDKLNSVKIDLNDKISKIKVDGPRPDNDKEFLLIANRLDQMEKLLGQMMRNPVAGAPPVAANGNLDEIKFKLGSIEQAILKLQPSEKRIALAAPSPDAPAVKPATSHVIFVNLYNQDLWIWVNQKQYRAPSNTTVTLDAIPAGPATIEVRSPDGIFHKSNPTLVANETFTLTAR